MPSNSENEVWNENHQGCRVPINDTLADGAPFQLNASPEWEDGCASKAVYETHKVSEAVPPVYEDDIDGQAYQLHLSSMLKYLNNDMLYGVSADARNTVPGSAMSLRGYPTPVLLLESMVLEDATSDTQINFDGTIGATSLDTWVVFSRRQTIKYALPYDLVFTVTYTVGLALQDTIEARIQAGFTKITDYREVGNVTWIPVEDNKLWFSTDSSGLVGTVTFYTEITNIVQIPYYGATSELNVVVTSLEYAPGGGSEPLASKLYGGTWFGVPLNLIEQRIAQCREMSEIELSVYSYPHVLLKKLVDPFALGTILYLDKAATIPASAGSYLWATYAYDGSGTNKIYKLVHYVILSSNGVIIYIQRDIDLDHGYLESPCWDLIPQ